ncbi:MAG: SMP-30/gluconolactonase/LRE family protein [Planctomycetes bacterium]|nr:SMP-30/gluconolactonase/LRE family protein [Planctomycetota bacterium]
MSEASLILDVRATLGEGPIWDTRESVLWWIDINECRLHRFDPATNRNEAFEIGQRVGTVVPRASGGLMLAVQDGFATYDPEIRKLGVVADPEAHLPQNRFNDGKCDPAGRFWAGTLELVEEDMTAGTLYCLYPDGRVEPRVPDVGISNGIVWTSDKETMYFIDSPTRRVDAFDYDNETGEISNRRTAIALPEGMGYPDGMAIDSEDKLWVALWAGWGVARFDPITGDLLEKIDVKASQVTACAFGGPGLRDLYITTARRDLDDEALKAQPDAGGMFHIKLDVAGVPSSEYAG